MKRIFLLLLAAVLCGLPAAAQSLCFWTDDASILPIRIYIDHNYLGDVTEAFEEEPLLDTPGCLSVDTTPHRHELTAVDKYGRVYKGWPGTIRPRTNEINYLKMQSRYFRIINRADYEYVFWDWIPIYTYADIPVHIHTGGLPIEDLDPLTDNGLLIGMGVAAVGATAAMTVAAARNWKFPDNRFPYTAIGLSTEVMPILREWRNVAQFRARFGNLGGVSLLADAGVATSMDAYRHDYHSYGRARRWPSSAFTFSVGAGLDYGGFGFSVRYKPAFENSTDTFLVARLAYDWWVTKDLAIDFHGGFGVGGFGREGLFDYYEFPFGVGVLFRL
ncbi:MAG: hypothetical protein J6W98_02250 [Bacteroidales bacterium]|nr:hypothetical protein [Bacteroidales bacterium]